MGVLIALDIKLSYNDLKVYGTQKRSQQGSVLK